MSDIEKTIKEMIAKDWGLIVDEIGNDKLLIKDLKGDSLDIVELSMNLEETFKIDLKDETVEGWQTVQHVIDDIKRLVV